MTLDENDINNFLIKLKPWLKIHAPEIGVPITMKKFMMGQSNPTFEMVTKKGVFVVRMQPAGVLLKSAHAVDREFRVMSALQNSKVPVPKMIVECQDINVIGRKFFVMEKVVGKTISDPALENHSRIDRLKFYKNQNSILIALAGVDPMTIGLADFGRPNGYMDRQIVIWKRQYRASQTNNLRDMEYLINNLKEALSKPLPGLCLIHGDFRLDNMLVQKNTEIHSLIDWELSTLGPAFIDLSYWCAMLRMSHDWPICGLGGIDRLKVGIPAEEDIVTHYCYHTGYEKPSNWDALIAFQCFRFAAILQGVLKRHIDGNASSQNAVTVGKQSKPVAELGATILQRYLSKSHN